MADEKITQLDPVTSLADTDLLVAVTDPGGTPETVSITVSDARASIVPAIGFAASRDAAQAAAQNAHAIIIPDNYLNEQGVLINHTTGLITVVQPGYYSLFANISQSAGTACFARIWKNPTVSGGNVTTGTQVTYLSFNSSSDDGRLAATLYLAANDTIAFTCQTNNAAGGNITARHLTMIKVR